MRSLNTIIILLVLSIPTFASVRSISQSKNAPNELLKWEVVDIPFKTKAINVENPFKVEFSANLTGPGNATMNIPGFYNGNGEWIIRLSFSVPGQWTYKTSSTMKELANKTGTLTVLDKAKQGARGGIVINPENPQHFIYEDGTPFFLLAYECDWLFALTGEYKKLKADSLAVGDKKIISDWQGDIHIESPWRGEADAILITEIVNEQ